MDSAQSFSPKSYFIFPFPSHISFSSPKSYFILLALLRKPTGDTKSAKRQIAPNRAIAPNHSVGFFFLLITTHQNITFGPMGKLDWPCGSMQSQSDTNLAKSLKRSRSDPSASFAGSLCNGWDLTVA
jgi:hypothetical protein